MRQLLRFLRDNDLRTILAALHSREVHPLIQFLKYGLCGVAATMVHALIFFVSAKYFIPGLESNCPDQWERAKASVGNNAVALIFSNATAYALNVKWVFIPGRHSMVREFLYFTLVNLPGAVCGGLVSYWVTAQFDWPTWAAFGMFVLLNVMINFTCRKQFIFKR